MMMMMMMMMMMSILTSAISASCSFYSYIPHFPSPSPLPPSFLLSLCAYHHHHLGHISKLSNTSAPSNNSLYRSVAHFWTRSHSKKKQHPHHQSHDNDPKQVYNPAGYDNVHGEYETSPISPSHSNYHSKKSPYSTAGEPYLGGDLSLDDILITRLV